MRPKKKILLVCASDDRLSDLKYMLWVNKYEVFGETSTSDALELLRDLTVDLLLCELPLPGVEDLLAQAQALNSSMRSLMMGNITAEIAAGLFADVIYQARPFKAPPSSAELLERIKVLCARKRGPISTRKPPQHEPLIVCAAADSRQLAGVA